MSLDQTIASASPTPSPDAPPVSLELFWEAACAYQKTAAIKAAVELDVFTRIGTGAHSVTMLAEQTGAAQRGLRILCDYLTVSGFLEKKRGDYDLTPSSQAFLDRRSPSYCGSVLDFIASPQMAGQFLDDPASFVRNGGATDLANVAPDNPVWVTFAETLTPMAAPSAEALAARVAARPQPPRKVLDIAAGHGLYGIAIAKVAPNAEIVAVDWQAVLAVALRNAEKADLGGRYRTIAGSAFEVDWGSAYDLVLLPNFLHHFDHQTCVALLAKIRAGLSSEGQAWAVEFVPNEDRISPAPMPATFAYIMLATTPKGDAYTPSELNAIAIDAGFRGATVSPLTAGPESLVTFDC
jgi:ubiquinone/menaquinone biosynthesis C-methylase UbiE